MEPKKMGFFKRIKNAILNFEEYKTFGEEKIKVTIKYILKLAFIFSLIVSLALTYKIIQEIDKAVQIYKDECPEFRIEDNILIIDEENKQFIKGDNSGYFGVLINSEKEEVNQIQEASNYQMVVAALKDKIVIKNFEGMETEVEYKELSKIYDINTINKQEIIRIVTDKEMVKVYSIVIIISIIYIFILYFIQFLADILLLSVIGYLLSKIVGVKFSYKSIFNMSAYAITLSIILYMIYIIANLFTGFTIRYFEMAYNAIAYIYIITAMLMIKSDLIKQQIEVGKIVEEQKKIREEKQNEQEQDEKKEKQDKEKNNEEEKERNSNEEEQPEGNQA